MGGRSRYVFRREADTRINDPLCEAVWNSTNAPKHTDRFKPYIGTDIRKGGRKHTKKFFPGRQDNVQYACHRFSIKRRLSGIKPREEHACDLCVLAVGHSSRDTFERLLAAGVEMHPKSFAVGCMSAYARMSTGPCTALLSINTICRRRAISLLTGRERIFIYFLYVPRRDFRGGERGQQMVTNGMSYNARAGKNSTRRCWCRFRQSIRQRHLDGAEFSLAGSKGFEMGGGVSSRRVRVGDFMEGRLSKKLGG